VHGGTNHADNDTNDSTTNNSTGITLNPITGNSNQAYEFAPVFYYTQDGTIKAAHAVDVLGASSGRSFWLTHYGQKPDPALHLPLRFTITSQSPSFTWDANPDVSHKQLRGFFLRKPTLNPVTNDYDYLSAAPTDGDTVRIEVNVYNYSVSQGFSNCVVRFYAVPYDSTTGRESATRTQIGETVVSRDPLGMTPAVLEWDTTGFGPTQSGVLASYRIYVVLDPENAIDEIYETDTTGLGANSSTCTDPVTLGSASCNPGQNNAGWGLISIAAPGTVSLPFEASLEGADVHMRSDAVAALDLLGRLQTAQVQAVVDQPVRLRISVHSDRSLRAHHHLLVYDGEPEAGGEVIAGKILPGIDAQGSHAWIGWRPRTPGLHRIVARVLEKHSDRLPGNNEAVLPVTVMAASLPDLSVTNFQGKAENVGSGKNNGTLQLRGHVLGAGTRDLRVATLELTDLLRERNGAGALVHNSVGSLLPLQLTAQRGSTATAAIFETSSAAGAPKVRVEIKQRAPHTGDLDFSIEVERATIETARLCGSTPSGSTPPRTRFSLTDGVHGPVGVSTEQNWQCKKNQLKTP
jgi:hypothetical protein